MRPATPAFTECLYVEMTVSAPPAMENTHVTSSTPAEQEPERWDGLS